MPKTTITTSSTSTPSSSSSLSTSTPSQQTANNTYATLFNNRYSNSSIQSSGNHKDENISNAVKSVSTATRQRKHADDEKNHSSLADEAGDCRKSHKYERDYDKHAKGSKNIDYRHDERRKLSSSASHHNKERYRSGEESRHSREHGSVTSFDAAVGSSRKSSHRSSATHSRSQHSEQYTQQQQPHHYNQTRRRHHRSYDDRSKQRRQRESRSRSRSRSRTRTRSRSPTAAKRSRRRERVRGHDTRSRSYTRSLSCSRSPDKRHCAVETHPQHHQHHQQQLSSANMRRSKPTSYPESNSHDTKKNQTLNTVPVAQSATLSALTNLQKVAASAATTAAAGAAAAAAATQHIPALMSLTLPHKYQGLSLTAGGHIAAGLKGSAQMDTNLSISGLDPAGVPAAEAPVQLPSYYNPSVINATKYAEQAQKRKLLWGSKKSEDSAGKWDHAQFSQDSDGKVASKFMRLMGIKNAVAIAGGSPLPREVSEPNKSGKVTKTETQCGEFGTGVGSCFGSKSKLGSISSSAGNKNVVVSDVQSRERMFSSMEKQYEVARQATHTMRGVGLGFSTQPRTF